MLTSKALLLGTTIFAVFSFYALFHSLYQFQLKFDDTSNINFLSQDNPTWFQRKAKVVFVIVDGLRFDYLLNYKNIEHDTTLDGNKFHKFNQAYFDNPDKFVIFKAFADLPTMTVLRVPCMMTGNVPRLGSVLTAFGALPATEDSIPRQLYLHQKKSYFAGDPILPQYFPKYLTSDFTIGAFNVRDRFVDDPSHSFMNEKLKKNDFDFLGGHFLEVDHAGHHSGLATKLMKKSIASLDKYLLEIINNIDDDTMLLFAGDHGMTKVGSHGGGSHQETNTAIVAYYKKGFMKNKYKNRHLKKVMRSINETQGQVNQIDIVPTLSMLMGLPTPFSNMGQILNDLYPVGDYLPSSQQNCHDSAFIMQMLQDNHLNTLQIWNYFKRYHDEQDLFNQQEYLPVAELYQEVDAAYKAADEMIKEHRQCEQSFHKIALDAIQKSQQLANQIHDLVSHKPPHDLIIFWQAFILLVLVSISYILQVQYLHKTKDYEYINFTWTSLENWNGKAIAKRVSPLAIILTLIWVYALTNSYPLMRPITSTVLALGLWILGSSIISFFFKPQEQLSPATTLEDEEQRAFSFSIKSFVLFQNPLVFACAAGIVSCLFYLTHIAGLRKSIIPALPSEIPYICVILLAFRISGRYLKLSPYIIGAAVFVCVGINIFHLSRLWSQRNNIILGLVMIADWLWGEAQFTNKKLKAGKIWSYQYIAGFIVLVFYHHILRPSSDLVQIYLPRVIWAIAIGSILTSFVLKMPRKVIKRNMQINLVIFLTLMQVHKKLIYFGVALSIMRIATFIFKRTSFKNYLYPLILGLLTFSLRHNVRNLSENDFFFYSVFLGLANFCRFSDKRSG